MALIISGNPRSGTTILQKLCNRHPNISVTNEFGNFAFIDKPYVVYSLQVMMRWYQVRNKWAFDLSYNSMKSKNLYNFIFINRYLLGMVKHYRDPITVQIIEAALKHSFPESSILGDKWPLYMFLMDKFVNINDLYCLVIYRDCRDVTSSFLEQVRTAWRRQAWINNLNTAKKVARHWVDMIGLMEHHAAQLHIVCYEDLIDNPKAVFASIGNWLGVDPIGFPTHEIKRNSIGKYKSGLTGEELAAVMDIAGPTMTRLGYI